MGTDTTIALRNAELATSTLRAEGSPPSWPRPCPTASPSSPATLPGAISLPAEALVAVLEGGAGAFLGDGFAHVCLINHHLEPGQLAALEQARQRIAATHGEAAVSVPQVISRRWGRQLTAEFKSGACHAGSYETSLVLAVHPEQVAVDAARDLPAVPVSLSAAIHAGATSFLEAGAEAAYTGTPADATAAEGEATYAVLARMVATEVLEHLERMSR
ncbi:MAG: creatininase family protein [bacterium]